MLPVLFSKPKANNMWHCCQRWHGPTHWQNAVSVRLRTGKLCHWRKKWFQDSKSRSHMLTRWKELSGAWAHLAVQRTVLQSHWISTSILNFWIKKSKNLAHPPSYKTTFVAFEFKQMKQSALKQLAKYNTDKACIHQEFNCIPPCAIKSAQLLTRCIKNKTSFAPPTQMNFNLLWKN